MHKNAVDMTPKFTLDVSPQEREAAKNAKKRFKGLIKLLKDRADIIFDLRDAIVKERPTQDQLVKRYRGRILRKKRQVQGEFNELLAALKSAVEDLAEITDSEMVKLRELIVSEFDRLSDTIESILTLFGELDRDGFTQELEKLAGFLEKRIDTISDLIDNQLFSHLDDDILGRKKISSWKAGIYKRRRLMRKM